jgi:hypothetical protein
MSLSEEKIIYLNIDLTFKIVNMLKIKQTVYIQIVQMK